MSQETRLSEQPATPPGTATGNWSKLGLFIAVEIAVVAAALILMRMPFINGSWYWHWVYRNPPATIESILFIAVLVTGLLGVAFNVHRNANSPERVALSIALTVLAGLVLRGAGLWLQTTAAPVDFLDHVVRNPIIGSYYTSALMVRDHANWIGDFPAWMAHFPLHAQNKPPGLVVFNLAFIEGLGNGAAQRTAAAVGAASALFSMLSVPLCYGLVRVLKGSKDAAFHVAALWTLAPGAVIFCPLFDPSLTVFALALAISWVVAMRGPGYLAAGVTGTLLALSLFFTFNILPIGFFLGIVGFAAASGNAVQRVRRFVLQSIIVVVVTVTWFAVLRVTLDFDVIQTLRAALENQQKLLQHIVRPYPATIWWDLVDYALGVAWVPLALAVVYLIRVRRPMVLIDIAVIAGLLQLLVVAISALLPGETARVWNFLFPLILLPAGLEMAKWPRLWPVLGYAAMAIVSVLVTGSMIFMSAP